MPHGKITSACAGIAAGSLPLVPFDPTLIATGVFLVAGTGAVAGSTYHAVKGTVKLTIKFCDNRRQKKVQKYLQNNPSPGITISIDHIVEFEDTVRKLSSSFTGLLISGTLTVVLPHCLVSTCFSLGETIYLWGKLRQIIKTYPDIHWGTLSKTNLSLQILGDVFIKLLTTTLFMGHDFEVFIEGMSHVKHAVLTIVDVTTVNLPNVPSQTSQAVMETHSHMIDHGLLKKTTEVVSMPGDKLGELLVDGKDYVPVWTDGPKTSHLIARGVVNTGVETVAGRIVEEPIHKVLNTFSKAVKTNQYLDMASR